jgi:hypothetical protein
LVPLKKCSLTRAGAIQRSAQALGALFALRLVCQRNAVTGNSMDGVKRLMANENEGNTPGLGDGQARKLEKQGVGEVLLDQDQVIAVTSPDPVAISLASV